MANLMTFFKGLAEQFDIGDHFQTQLQERFK